MLRRSLESLREIFSEVAPSEPGRSDDLFSSTLSGPAKRHETYRSDEQAGLNLPVAVVPDEFDLEDFFATTATYYQEFSPVSAVVHVLGRDESRILSDRRPKSQRRSDTSHTFREKRACLGATIGEAVISGIGFLESGTAPAYAACRRTLAFALGRSAIVNGTLLTPDTLVERWASLRRLTGLSVSDSTVAAVRTAHVIAFELSQDAELGAIDHSLAIAIGDFVTGNDVDGSELLRLLIHRYPRIEAHIEQLHGSYDARLAAFTQIVTAVHAESRGLECDQIAVAFMCNQILPGSLSHIAVLEKLVEVFPASIVWYGFFAMLSTSTKRSDQSQPRSLMLKLERDLVAPFSIGERPMCDISLQELEVLSRVNLRPDWLNPSQQRALLVSIAPGVDIFARIPGDGDGGRESARRDQDIEAMRARISGLLEEALAVLRNSSGERNSSRTAPRRTKRER
jgi:hypothetical protein